ncbi:hypothetical protein Avbf_15709 [Armadillidium vulgare]|nr:hypothetical protein Avbf_15709 [Armadillidium vulgare]
MWNQFRKTFVLLLVFISSTRSDDGCDPRQFLVKSRMIDIVESINLEANFWIKPESDFERIEIQIKVKNIRTFFYPFYHHNHMVLEPQKILDSSYYIQPYWIPLTVKVFERNVTSSGDKLIILKASFNDTFNFELDNHLWCSEYQYEKYKLSAKGGFSFSSCNPSSSTTESHTDQKTPKDNPISNNNSTRTNKAKSWDENYRKIESNNIKKTRERFLIISLTVIAFLSVLIIIAIYILECRYKDVDENLKYLQRREEKGEDNTIRSRQYHDKFFKSKHTSPLSISLSFKFLRLNNENA